MAIFWHWCVRNPALLAAMLFLAAGAATVIAWPLAFSGAAFFGCIAKIANHLGRFAKRRRQSRAPVDLFDEALDPALQQRVRELDEGLERAA